MVQKRGGPLFLESEWAMPMYSSQFKKGWLRKLLNVVVGDVVGAVTGAIVGGIFLGEPGVVLGAIVGAMGGSLAAADGKGIIEYFN